jgi:LemA protein
MVMEPIFLVAGIVIVLILILVLWWISTSNGFRRKAIKIGEALSGIEVALTKRYDMLTKLLDVAKGYAAHEKELFTQVIELRRGMSIAELSEKSARMDDLSARLFAVAENYPQLRSAEVFGELQAGIRDAEEHLQAARRLYNSNVTAFNTAVDIFPSSIVAKSQGIRKEHEFFATEAAKREDVKMGF